MRACPTCQGTWISGNRHLDWLARAPRPADAATSESFVPTKPASDSTKAKLCPDCGRLLTRYAVGKGISFSIERCGGCAGIWLDSHELDALRSAGLADRLHLIFSAAWQAEISRAAHEAAHLAMLQNKLGPVDFARARELRSWIAAHPQKQTLLAFLTAP